MILVNPIKPTDATLTASTIAEPSTGETVWASGTTYNTGDEVIGTTTHRVYRSAIDSNTGNDPTNDDGTKWVEIRATNRWRMFDKVIGSQSTGDDVTISLLPGKLYNAIAGINITNADSINVTMTDPTDGVVYNRDVSMVDNDAVTDWYAYFFSPIININQFALFDLPPYPSASLEITITGTDVGVGEIVFGEQVTIGTTQYGSGWQPSQFGVRERDEFGNFNINIIATTDIMNYNVKIDKNKFAYVRSVLTALGSEPSVFAATAGSDTDAVLAYGYYDNININFSSPSLYDATISVQGLA